MNFQTSNPKTAMNYDYDKDPYVSDARPDPMQRRLCAFFIALTFDLFCLFAFSGCYGTAIDTRSITADEVTISQNTPWSNLTITAKGWKSDVKGQTVSPVAEVGGSGASETVHVKSNGLLGAATGDSLSQQETPGASAPESGSKNHRKVVVGNPDAPAPAGEPLSPTTKE
jgi:hypothetical protein